MKKLLNLVRQKSLLLSRMLLVILCLATATATFSACATLLPLIPQIVSIVTDAMNVLDIVDTAVNQYLRTHPNTPPEFAQKYAVLYAKTRTALNAATNSLKGVSDLDQKQYDSAFAEFKTAYLELTALLEKQGVTTGGYLTASLDSGPVRIPEPEALRFQVQKR
jgi:hypothetical protein